MPKVSAADGIEDGVHAIAREAANLFHKVGRQRVGVGLQVQPDGLFLGGGGLGGRNFAVLQHGVDHQIAATKRALRAVDGRVGAGRFG